MSTAADRAKDRAYSKRRRDGLRNGTWQPGLVDATPVREHLLDLHRQGMSYREMARQAGETLPQIATLTHEDRGYCPKKLTRVRAERLLALHFDVGSMLDTTRIPSVGARRRIQALQVMGWPLDEIARRLCVTISAVWHYQLPDHERIYVGTYKRVCAIYKELSMVPGPSQITANRAARHGWAGPLCWDDDTIDDPNAIPHGLAPRSAPTKHEVTYRHRGDVYECCRCGVVSRKGHRDNDTGLCKSCYDLVGRETV